jgi:hypothetical protein
MKAIAIITALWLIRRVIASATKANSITSKGFVKYTEDALDKAKGIESNPLSEHLPLDAILKVLMFVFLGLDLLCVYFVGYCILHGLS